MVRNRHPLTWKFSLMKHYQECSARVFPAIFTACSYLFCYKITKSCIFATVKTKINKNQEINTGSHCEYSDLTTGCTCGWLGRLDSNQRSHGIKTRCLTAWLRPNMTPCVRRERPHNRHNPSTQRVSSKNVTGNTEMAVCAYKL